MKNKELIKTFLVIGMVVTFYLIFPVVLGIITIKKIENSEDPEEIKKWGTISLFCVSLVAGLLILTSDIGEIGNENINRKESNSPESFLIELKKLYEEGIIEPDFYDAKRKEYLEKL